LQDYPGIYFQDFGWCIVTVKYATTRKYQIKMKSLPPESKGDSKTCKSCALKIPIDAASCFACGTDQKSGLLAALQRLSSLGLLLTLIGTGLSFYALYQANIERLKAEDAAEKASIALGFIEKLVESDRETLKLTQTLASAAQSENIRSLQGTFEIICAGENPHEKCTDYAETMLDQLKTGILHSVEIPDSDLKLMFCSIYSDLLRESEIIQLLVKDRNEDEYSTICEK